MRWFFVTAAVCSVLVASAAVRQTLFHEDFEDGLQAKWKPVKFEGQTEHAVVQDGGTRSVKAHAKGSASGLAVELNAPTEGKLELSWRWKIDKIPPGSTETDKKTFDHTARIFVSHKPRFGLPTTLNYVWASSGKVGDVFEHPSSGRSKFIILQVGNAGAGKWMPEKRNISADWKRVFGDEMPKTISALGFMTDSDGTKSEVVGHYDDFLLVRE